MSALHFTEEIFERDIINGKGIALVDFWADWCPPCRALAPVIEEIATEMDGRVLVGKVDVDELGSTAQRFGIMSIPTVMIFRDGIEVGRIIGGQPKINFINALETALAN